MSKMKSISVVVLFSLTAAIATAQPVVSAVANGASNTLNGLPGSPLAEGSIGVAYGRNLGPANLVAASGLPWPTTLSGTSAQIEASGQTINLPIYYTSAAQIGFLVPSNTPVGGGTIRVTYNGQTSANFGIPTSRANLGIFTRNSRGFGPAIVTYSDFSLVSQTRAPNCGGPSTDCGAANPGQTLILWATGLGPVTGNETTTPLPGDMTDHPLRLWIGGVQANIVYRGRSGCCVGVDQIAFVVPEGVSGCNVPIFAQINNGISNYATIPIAPTGSTCTSSVAGAPPDFLARLMAAASPSFGFISFDRNERRDRAGAAFLKLNGSGQLLTEAIETLPLGTCMVRTFFNAGGPEDSDPFSTLPFSLLDAGASLAVSGPGGRNRMIPRGPDGDYNTMLGNTSSGNYLDPGVYTITGTGGRDIGGFNTSITIPQPFVWTNPPGNARVMRANGLTVNWTGGDPNGVVHIRGDSAVLTAPNSDIAFAGAQFDCIARASANTFLIPPTVLLTLPPQPVNPPPGARPVVAFIDVIHQSLGALFTAPGLDFGVTDYEQELPGVPVSLQ